VRPTDQNQTGSRRPNLMSSSRRSGAEINILAMLDGQARKPRRFARLPKAAWYGGGGVLACALVATVAWLVHDQAGSGFEGRVPAGPPMVALDIAPEPLPNPALHVDPPRGHAAVLMNVADAAVPAHQSAPALPAVMADAAPSTQPSAAPSTIGAAAPVAVAAAVPASARAARPVPHAHPKTLSRASAPARRTAAPPRPKPAPAPVDTDVALISAIIQHVNQRGELKDASGCGDKACPAKMTNRP
jgi:hypothetical protein